MTKLSLQRNYFSTLNILNRHSIKKSEDCSESVVQEKLKVLYYIRLSNDMKNTKLIINLEKESNKICKETSVTRHFDKLL